MSKPRRALITDPNKLAALLQAEKFIYDDIQMIASDKQPTRSIFSTRIIYDENFETFTGLSLNLLSTRAPGFIYHSFSLHFEPNHRHKDVFAQLEIEPADKLAHTELGGIKIYGAHYVELNKVTNVLDNEKWTWYNWFNDFCQRTKLTHTGTRCAPFEGELDL